MRVEVYEILYGNYKFTAELDTGAETGEKQLTVWFAEKVDVEQAHFTQFSINLLLKALQEPFQSRLHAQLEEEKIICQQEFETQITTLQRPFQAINGQKARKLPNKVKRDIRTLRQRMKSALQRLEVQFIKRELVVLEKQYFDLDMLQGASHIFGDAHFLRDFYFEEADKRHIRDFCQKFALDEAYRQEVLDGRTHWAKRDALFMRNLPSIVGKEALFANDGSYDRKMGEFFQWLDAHCEEILALPEYQWMQEIDSTLASDVHELDPDIKLTVELFNQVPGVTIQFSCQGVSGKVLFQG